MTPDLCLKKFRLKPNGKVRDEKNIFGMIKHNSVYNKLLTPVMESYQLVGVNVCG